MCYIKNKNTMKKISISIAIVCSLIFQVSALSLSKEGIRELESANFLADKWIIRDVRIWLDITDTQYELIGWGEIMAIMDGYRLHETITRKEAMKIVMKLSGKTITDTCRWVFSDVPADWWCKYIEAALDAWYIAANPTFRPDDNITKTEAMKLVLKAKWVQKIEETDAWQSDYMETAYFYGIIDDKYTDFNANAFRGWIFTIATATIEKEDEIFEKGWIISDEAL